MAQLGQLGRQLVMLPLLWGSNKINWEDPTNQLTLQVAFGVVLVVVRCRALAPVPCHACRGVRARRLRPPPLARPRQSAGVLQLTLLKIGAAKDTARVAKPGDSQFFSNKAEDGSVSAEEYDTAKAKETRTQLLMGGGVCTFLHFQFGYVQPLLMTCVMNLFHLWDCKAVHIHLLGKQVERPWAAAAAANPLQQWAERKKAEAEAAQKETEEEAKKQK